MFLRISAALFAVFALMGGSFDKAKPAALAGTEWHGVVVTSPSGIEAQGNTRDYQIEFRDETSVRLKLDCNSAGGSYQASDHGDGSGDLRFGAMRMTRAKCWSGSLQPVITGMLGAVRAYTFSGDSLIMTLDGGGSLVWSRK